MGSNELTARKVKFSTAITSQTYQKLIGQTLGDKKKAERYTAAIMSAVATNPALQECESATILSGSLLAESLNLSHSPQLGRYYLVPFKDKKTGTTKAQFILGYKGYIELAVRSGQYKRINAMPIKEGELISYDPFNDEIQFRAIQDPDERESAKTIGYYAMFEYVNGFKKVIYWSKAQMLAHADKYSPAFNKASYEKLLNGEIPDRDLWKYSSFWYKDFDSMAKKTLIRQLISKWGVMSTEMVQAIDADNNVVKIDRGNFLTELPEGENPFDIPEAPDAEPETDEPEEVNFDEL